MSSRRPLLAGDGKRARRPGAAALAASCISRIPWSPLHSGNPCRETKTIPRLRRSPARRQFARIYCSDGQDISVAGGKRGAENTAHGDAETAFDRKHRIQRRSRNTGRRPALMGLLSKVGRRLGTGVGVDCRRVWSERIEAPWRRDTCVALHGWMFIPETNVESLRYPASTSERLSPPCKAATTCSIPFETGTGLGFVAVAATIET